MLLDEVGDLPLAAQVKLLRVLQEGEIKRVGADETRNVDVRVVAATNIDLVDRIQSGDFRRDLYYRLNVICIELPPLRERGDDVLLLANHFLQKLSRSLRREFKGLAPDALRALREYSWPGNVRELEHAMEHAMVLSQKDHIDAADLPFTRPSGTLRGASAVAPTAEDVVDTAKAVTPDAEPRSDAAQSVFAELAELPYGEAKRRLVSLFDESYTGELLRRTGGNTSEAARRAGLDRSNFRRLLKRHKDEP